MASSSEIVSECQKNDIPTKSEGHPDSEPTHNDIKGWLSKRGRLSRKWTKQWFEFRNCDLVYGKSEDSELKKKINLTESHLSETNMDKKKFAFRIKCKENGRTYYIKAENEQDQNLWMQAICFAKTAGSDGSNSQACVIQ